MTGAEFLKNAWRRSAGLPEVVPQVLPPIDQLRKTEWSPVFERLMRNRLMMGAIRYGLLNSPGKPKYDRIASMEKRLRIYRETGNMELLVDVANLALCEFEEGTHPKRHFKSADDKEHVKQL